MSESTVAVASPPPHRRWDATEEDALDAGPEPTTTTAREGRREAEGRGGGRGTPGRENNR